MSNAQAPRQGRILQSLLAAKAQTRHLMGERLEHTVEAMVNHADALGASALLGASEGGHALAGAMAYRSKHLRLWLPPESSPVLLIDTVVASLAGISCAAEQARSGGATSVDALILGIVACRLASEEASVEHLAMLEPPELLAA
jgi:hypothetical protein